MVVKGTNLRRWKARSRAPLGHNIDSYIRPPFVGSDVCLKTWYILSFFIRSFLPFITNLLRPHGG